MRDNMDMDVSKSPDGKEPVSGAGKRIFEEIATVASGTLKKAKKMLSERFCHI
jgi:altronate dehydratase